jgi:hypothetical protein
VILLAIETGALSVDRLIIDKERLAIGNDKYLEMIVLISI